MSLINITKGKLGLDNAWNFYSNMKYDTQV